MSDLSQLSMQEHFRMEAESNTQILVDGLLALERDPTAPDPIEPCMPAAHPSKGAARLAATHAAAIGKDVDRDELTVVGIGDMSGEVFGNGLLRSTHGQLMAAFDHRHVFIDPDPDPAASFTERAPLLNLPRSS